METTNESENESKNYIMKYISLVISVITAIFTIACFAILIYLTSSVQIVQLQEMALTLSPTSFPTTSSPTTFHPTKKPTPFPTTDFPSPQPTGTFITPTTYSPTASFAGLPNIFKSVSINPLCEAYQINYSILDSTARKQYSRLTCLPINYFVFESQVYKSKFDFPDVCFQQCLDIGPICKAVQKTIVDDKGSFRCQGLPCNPFDEGSFYGDSNNKRNKFIWFDNDCFIDHPSPAPTPTNFTYVTPTSSEYE